MNQPLDSQTTVVHAAGTGARMHAHIERRAGIDPWVVVKAEADQGAVSLLMGFDQARQLLDALTVVCAAAHIRGEGCAA